MHGTTVIRGRLVGPTQVELEQPVSNVADEVEVVVRARVAQEPGAREDLLSLLDRIPPGTRTREDIDEQIREERESWGEP